LFTAQGYFSKTVIPAEMELDNSQTIRDGRIIHYTPTLGEHPDLTGIVQQRIEAIIAQENLSADQVAVAIIGHGTPRSRASQNVTRQQATLLRHLAAEVVAVYLDDNPAISSIYELTSAPNIIAVPFFLATGSHVTQDVPQALGIQTNNRSTWVNGRQVYYTPPVGTHDTVCQLILDLARSTGIEFSKQVGIDDWHGFPQVGSEQLMADIQSRGALQFGQLTLTPAEVRPNKVSPAPVVLRTPAALRQHIRANPFRPLATSADLPQDWRVPITSAHMLPAVVETIYPGALADWSHRGDLRANSLEIVSKRQTGMFKDIHTAPSMLIEHAVQTLCGQCVRFPAWHSASTEKIIPCKSPCNWWLSRVKESIA
jgi:sirohydrochlorin cobaltochelatase